MILHFDRVTDGEDVGVAGPHPLVHTDPAALADREPSRLRQRGVRTHAEREDHHIGRMDLAGFRMDGDRAARVLLERGDAVPECQMDAVPREMRLHHPGILRIDGWQDLVGQLDKGHVEAAMNEVLDHLQADEPAADDHGPRLGPYRLEAGVFVHAGQEGRAAFDPAPDLPRIRHRPDVEDARQVDAGQRRAH
jgi:hypothetical protein